MIAMADIDQVPVFEGEPWGSREQVVIAAIAWAFTSPTQTMMPLASQETTETGRHLPDRMTNRWDVKRFMREALTYRQYMILWRRFGKGDTRIGTAKHFHLDLDTVSLEEFAGLQTMVQRLWHDADYVSPRTRTRRRDAYQEFLRVLKERQRRASGE